MPAYSLVKTSSGTANENGTSSSNIVKLASNENPYGCSPSVKKFLGAGYDQLNRYPDSDCFELKKKLSEKNSVEINQIFLGNGSNEVLDYIAKVFLTSGRHAIYGKYCFAVYPLIVKAAGANAIVADPTEGFGHDLAVISPHCCCRQSSHAWVSTFNLCVVSCCCKAVFLPLNNTSRSLLASNRAI